MAIADVTERRSKIFTIVFERIRDDVLLHTLNSMPMEAIEWLGRSIDLNVPGKKVNNIMSVAEFEEILRGRTLSDDEYFKATLLEWFIKFLQASRPHIYSPDEHHNQQCIYVGDDIVIEDSLWLYTMIYYLLKKYFNREAYYVQLLELFHEVTFQTEMGHLVNSVTTSKGHVDLSKFSLQKHAAITRGKITSFYLPVALAMCVCGVPESYAVHGSVFYPYATARSILLLVGEYSQIQNDFLNYVGTVGNVGEAKSDITENKCSWCINVALVVSSPEERKVLEENYGQVDTEKEQRVKEVYETIGLRDQYRVYETSLKERIEGMTAAIPEAEESVDWCALKREVFSSFLDKICNRTK